MRAWDSKKPDQEWMEMPVKNGDGQSSGGGQILGSCSKLKIKSPCTRGQKIN